MHHFKKTHKNDNSKGKIKKNVSSKAGARRQKGGVLPNFLRTQKQKDNILIDLVKKFDLENLDDVDAARIAIRNGANVNAKDANENTPLIHAAHNGFDDISQLLIESGADVNATNNRGITPLIIAIKEGRKNIARLLIENGADLGDIHVYYAIKNGNSDILKILIEKGVNIMNEGQKNLILAIDNSEYLRPTTQIIEILLEAGLGVDDSTIDYARRNGYDEIVEMFEETLPPHPPPLCMSQEEYDKCDKNADGEVIDQITQEPVIRTDAVKLEGQPKICYNRASLKQWTKNSKTNPFTRQPIDDDWIESNLNDGKCKEATVGAGKRKTLKKRKSNKK